MLRVSTVAALSLGFALSVQAMQPCREASGCIDDASAAMLTSIEEITAACSKEYPAEAKSYEAGLANELQQASPAFINAVRPLPAYSEAKVEARLGVANLSQPDVAREYGSFAQKEATQ